MQKEDFMDWFHWISLNHLVSFKPNQTSFLKTCYHYYWLCDRVFSFMCLNGIYCSGFVFFFPVFVFLHCDIFWFQTLGNCSILILETKITRDTETCARLHLTTTNSFTCAASVKYSCQVFTSPSLKHVGKKTFITESGPFTKFSKCGYSISDHQIQNTEKLSAALHNRVIQVYSVQVRSTAQPLPDDFLILTSPLMCVCCPKYFTEIELEKTIKKAWMPFQLLWLPRWKSLSLSKLQNRRHRKYLQGFSLPVENLPFGSTAADKHQ